MQTPFYVVGRSLPPSAAHMLSWCNLHKCFWLYTEVHVHVQPSSLDTLLTITRTRGILLIITRSRGILLIIICNRGIPLIIIRTRGILFITIRTRGILLIIIRTRGIPLIITRTRGSPLIITRTRGIPLIITRTRGIPLIITCTRDIRPSWPRRESQGCRETPRTPDCPPRQTTAPQGPSTSSSPGLCVCTHSEFSLYARR